MKRKRVQLFDWRFKQKILNRFKISKTCHQKTTMRVDQLVTFDPDTILTTREKCLEDLKKEQFPPCLVQRSKWTRSWLSPWNMRKNFWMKKKKKKKKLKSVESLQVTTCYNLNTSSMVVKSSKLDPTSLQCSCGT